MAALTVFYIDRYEDKVVQDNFKFGDDKEIVSRGSNLRKGGDVNVDTLYDRSWLCKIMFWR